MTQQRRAIQATQPVVRNTPMRAREWQRLLALADTEAVETDGGEMALVRHDGQVHLYFAFASTEELKAAFGPMWEALRPSLATLDVPYIRFELVAFPVREWIDPLLDEADFVEFGEWLELEHPTVADVVPPEFPSDVRMRRATPADHDRIVAIETEAYGEFADGELAMRARLADAAWSGVLETDGGVVAYALNSAPSEGVGRIVSTAVHPSAWGRGLGRLVVQAAAYQLASVEAGRAVVRGRPDSPRSVETAVAAGFRPGTAGIEFRRPLDEAAIAARRHDRQVQGMKVRFGDWR